jgi:hypothetical protein
MKTTRLFSMFILIAMFLGLSGMCSSCQMVGGVHGDGNVVKESRPVGSFNAIEVSGAFDIIIKQGATEELAVETDRNILPLVSTEVVGNTLKIETKKPIHHTTELKVYITVKDINLIDASGATDIVSDGKLTLSTLTLDASGSTDARLDLAVGKMKLDCSGASKVKFSGTATEVIMDLSGASDIFGFDLLAESYDIDISGAGNAQVNVSKRIRAEISGAGSVKYKGSPTEIDQSVLGAGSIRKVD